MNRRLGVCPTCRRGLDDALRESMGLRNGEILNALCPSRIGPSDIDHVLHNGKASPERLFFLEYKDGAPVTRGQEWLFKSVTGDWAERSDGRQLSIRHRILPQHLDEPESVLTQIVDWVFAS